MSGERDVKETLQRWMREDPALAEAVEADKWITDLIMLRSERGLTQQETAERAGTRQPAIARLESGKQSPTLSFLQRVVEALGGKLTIVIEPAEEAAKPKDRMECPPTNRVAKARDCAA